MREYKFRADRRDLHEACEINEPNEKTTIEHKNACCIKIYNLKMCTNRDVKNLNSGRS